MNILAIFDNGGETLDRYTVVFNEKDVQYYTMLGMNEGGQGFSQFTSGQYTPGGDNSHLGKPVKLSKLSNETKGHILHRMGA